MDARRTAPAPPVASEEHGHLVFFPYAERYFLIERRGSLPLLGSEVFLGPPAESTYVVTKVAASPLPGDARPCAYLERPRDASSMRAQRRPRPAITLAA